MACTCLPGYRGDGQHSCTDVNECHESNLCDSNAKCVNIIGSFRCECQPGFYGSGTSCQEDTNCLKHPCPENSQCEGHKCTCVSGYGWDRHRHLCVDQDECHVKTHNCDSDPHQAAICLNTIGSFDCRCQKGFIGNGTHCTDRDECSHSEIVCGPQATCTNLPPGSFTCSCQPGYTGDAFNGCSDIDECEFKCTDTSTSVCENYGGTYQCLCKAGYQYEGGECQDIDDCIEGRPCPRAPLGGCQNLPGTFNCQCPPGTIGSPQKCEDVDECLEKAHPCKGSDASCLNFYGSFECLCPRGFSRYDSVTGCLDADWCSLMNPCGANEKCVSLPDGGYRCDCESGFFKGNRTVGCEDKNECFMGPNIACHENANCYNFAGSFRCNCKRGFAGDGLNRCEDVNECRVGGGLCAGEGATCENTPGGYTCTCPTGTVGDGYNLCFEPGPMWRCEGYRETSFPKRYSMFPVGDTNQDNHCINSTEKINNGYLQVDFSESSAPVAVQMSHQVSRLVLHPPSTGSRVARLQLQVHRSSPDGKPSVWGDLIEGIAMTFAGFRASSSHPVNITLPFPVMALGVRLVPLSWDENKLPCFGKVDIYACECSAGTCGVGCSSKCRCADNSQCDADTCGCGAAGCAPGFSGPSCGDWAASTLF